MLKFTHETCEKVKVTILTPGQKIRNFFVENDITSCVEHPVVEVRILLKLLLELEPYIDSRVISLLCIDLNTNEQSCVTMADFLEWYSHYIIHTSKTLEQSSIPKNNAASVSFEVERDGNPENIMRGQGGSVANILSVGLRIFALRNLGDDHRRLLVLDEQDCWLRPDRVPELMSLVRQAAGKLGIQMIVISHHDEQLFEIHADRIFEFTPQRGGTVQVDQVEFAAADEDQEL